MVDPLSGRLGGRFSESLCVCPWVFVVDGTDSLVPWLGNSRYQQNMETIRTEIVEDAPVVRSMRPPGER